MSPISSQRQQARALLAERGIARLSEIRAAGITAATVSRMEQDGEVVRLARGLYQLSNAPLDAQHSLAEAAKRIPKGVVCLVSALAFHDLTDQLPRRVWLAIGRKDWASKADESALRIVRFADTLLNDSVEPKKTEGVGGRFCGGANTIPDCFGRRRTVGLAVAIEGLQEALRRRKATPGDIARHAERGGVATVMRPYIEALTANG